MLFKMSTLWTCWILSALVVFTGLETYSVVAGKETFSQYVRMVSTSWPPIIFVLGFAVGFLVAHFWWSSRG